MGFRMLDWEWILVTRWCFACEQVSCTIGIVLGTFWIYLVDRGVFGSRLDTLARGLSRTNVGAKGNVAFLGMMVLNDGRVSMVNAVFNALTSQAQDVDAHCTIPCHKLQSQDPHLQSLPLILPSIAQPARIQIITIIQAPRSQTMPRHPLT